MLTKAALEALEARFADAKTNGGRGMKLSAYDVIKSPVITEKSTLVSEANQVIFKVAPRGDQAADQGGGREASSTSR